MSDDPSSQPAVLEGLTPEEMAVLRKMLNRLEWQVLEAVVKRLRLMVLLAAGVLTAFGLASLATVRTAIVDAAAEKLAAQSEVRERVIAATSNKMEHVNEVLRQANSYEADLNAAKGRALTALSADLDDVLALVADLKHDMSYRQAYDEKTKRSEE